MVALEACARVSPAGKSPAKHTFTESPSIFICI
jgi:hypothetical protein